jgi:signal transduction histidine kinase
MAKTMTLQPVLQPLRLLAADVPARWRSLRLPYKVAAVASALVLACMVHLGVVVAGQVRENLIQRSAAAAALHMDSFVARHVQELATKPGLSEESKEALQKLLSPASMHRPVVAFRVWKGDTITFSNHRELIGKTFERTAARDRAWRGHVASELARPDGDDDEQVRSLNVPVLEIYAPVREGGTGRIIALVEIYELGVALERDVVMRQIASWAAIAAIALTIVLLLFSMANSGTIERNRFIGRIDELSFLQERGEQVRQRMRHAGLQVSHMNERSLRRLGTELQEGPGQLVALAMLKFDALNQLVADLGRSAPGRAEEHTRDLEAIRKALGDTLGHIRRVAGTLLVADIEELSVPEILARAIRHHQNKTGVPTRLEATSLPEHLPLPVKACLYRLALEGLDCTSPSPDAGAPSMSASCDGEKMVLVFHPAPDPAAGQSQKVDGLRSRIEAVGGQFRVVSTPSCGHSLVAELCLSRMDVADG